MVRNTGVDIDKIEFTLVHEKAKAFVEKSNDELGGSWARVFESGSSRLSSIFILAKLNLIRVESWSRAQPTKNSQIKFSKKKNFFDESSLK